MHGVKIISGARDWQIFQQENGVAAMTVNGCYYRGEMTQGEVYARVLSEDDQSVVLGWTKASMQPDNRFEVILANIPTGGLYRIETCFTDNVSDIEWAMRGDSVFHIGVGDLYVIAGQSNSAGYGKTPAKDIPELGIHLYRNSENWDIATHPMNDSTNSKHEINCEGGNSGNSPYLAFAKMLKHKLGYPIGLIQASLGGSSISMWNPDGNDNLYTNMLSVINTCTNGNNNVKGILWYQGCSDVALNDCSLYFERFKALVSALRKTLKSPKLPFLTMQLNKVIAEKNHDADIGWSVIREAQRKAADSIEFVYVTPTLDVALSDAIHNNSAANIVIGERVGNQALEKIYNLPVYGSAPNLKAVTKHSNNCIRLTFSNIYQYIVTLYLPIEQLPFTVFDGETVVPITAYSCSGDSIDLTVAGNIDGNFAVSCGYGATPLPYLPFDRTSGLPFLCFHMVAIELNERL